jgi:mannose-1-phosphate guanylyltransferase
MKIILLSGGSGKRLWPLSNDTRSKQFLKVLDNHNIDKQSMVQRVWNQLDSVGLSDQAIVTTSKIQTEMIRTQLGYEVPVVIEPERRDTFPAIVLAISYLYSIVGSSLNETIAVLPVDPYVDNAFFEKLKDMNHVLSVSNAELALIGVKPTYPSTKYGYIVPKESKDNYITVSHFTEKPCEEKAAKLIELNALWNCGVFAFKLEYIINIMLAKGIPLHYEDLLKQYSSLPKISFDYEVVEKTKNIVAIPYDGYWKDLGTWNTLTEEMATNLIGKGIISEQSENTHLINELDIPVVVHGIKNVVIAASPDGILVTDKALSPGIKDIIGQFDNPPMYEERIWGWSRTLDYAKYDNGEEMVTKRICINKNKNSTYHYHNYRDEVWTIVKGEGELALDDNITRVKAGDIVHIPSGKKHGIKAITDLEFIEVQTGLGISNEDFVRLYHNWDDVIKAFKKSKAKVIL